MIKTAYITIMANWYRWTPMLLALASITMMGRHAKPGCS